MPFVARVLGWAGEGNGIFLAAFVWMIGFALPFARRCMHCGLPKWAAVGPGPPPPGEARP